MSASGIHKDIMVQLNEKHVIINNFFGHQKPENTWFLGLSKLTKIYS